MERNGGQEFRANRAREWDGKSVFRFIFCFSLIVGLCQGCSSGNDSDSGASSQLLGPIPATPRAGVREQVQAMRAGAAVSDRMVDLVAAQCMKRANADFKVLPKALYEPRPIPHFYGLSLSQARKEGYKQWMSAEDDDDNRPADELTSGTKGQRKVTIALLGPDEGPRVSTQDVLVGGAVTFPTTGCLAEGRKAVYLDLTLWAAGDNFANNFVYTVLQEARDSEELIALNREWSECMSDQGLPDLDSPEAALAKARELLPMKPRRTDFVKTVPIARADSKCQVDTEYAQNREAIEDRYLTAGSERFADRIAQSRTMYRAAALRAKSLLP